MINNKIDSKSTNFWRQFWYWSEIRKILPIFWRDFDVDFKLKYEFIKVVLSVLGNNVRPEIDVNSQSKYEFSLMSLSWCYFLTGNRRQNFSVLWGENIGGPKNIGFWKSTRFWLQFQSESKIHENLTKFRRRSQVYKTSKTWKIMLTWCRLNIDGGKGSIPDLSWSCYCRLEIDSKSTPFSKYIHESHYSQIELHILTI